MKPAKSDTEWTVPLIPQLIAAGTAREGVIRVWVCGCSTGEEAYSIAMLLQEQLEASNRNCAVQIFAIDIDHRPIANAREGLFPTGIASDISPERLTHFFDLEPDGSGYRIPMSIREILVYWR